MKVLVFLEHHDGAVTNGSLGVLGKATELAGDGVAAVLVGAAPLAGLAAKAGASGAAMVYVAEDDSFDPPLPQSRVDVLDAVVRASGFDTVLFSNSVLAADVAAGLSARLEAGLNWDLVDLAERDGALVGSKLALADSVLVEVGWRSTRRVALFRAGSFDPTVTGGTPQVGHVDAEIGAHARRARIVGHHLREDEGPSIEDAEVVVAGGLGLGAAEHFALAESLAAVLGGVVGATRAAVYKGWYPAAAQVGQTGKTVTPRLYVALGISGAVQHKVGMQNSKVIVSINKDPRAPIFEFSDLSVVGDVHAVVPRLVELLQARASS